MTASGHTISVAKDITAITPDTLATYTYNNTAWITALAAKLFAYSNGVLTINY
jgi:hypothetical protein